MFGLNWRSTYEERVSMAGDGTVKYARGDGSFWTFGYFDNVRSAWRLVAPANGGAMIAQGASSWTLTFKNGEKRLFDNASGSLIAILDRNGNTTQLTYDSANRLAAVTDPASRHLNFSYSDAASPLAIGVTSDAGINLSYAYDGQGRLTSMVKQDGTSISFEYNDQSLITAVKDSNGKILESHIYDGSGRGLTSSRANGVEGVTVSYSQ